MLSGVGHCVSLPGQGLCLYPLGRKQGTERDMVGETLRGLEVVLNSYSQTAVPWFITSFSSHTFQ